MSIVLKSICMSYCKAFQYETQNIKNIFRDNITYMSIVLKTICISYCKAFQYKTQNI